MQITKTFNYDGTIMSFRYKGTLRNKRTNEDKIIELVNEIFENNNFCDPETIIKVIRTIFKDYKEQLLYIRLVYRKDIKEVLFNNGKLEKYKNSIAINHNIKNSDMVEFMYKDSEDISISVTNKFSDPTTGILKQAYRFASTEISYLSKLKKVKPVELSGDEILLNPQKLLKTIK